jgi:hypothetical protein
MWGYLDEVIAARRGVAGRRPQTIDSPHARHKLSQTEKDRGGFLRVREDKLLVAKMVRIPIFFFVSIT